MTYTDRPDNRDTRPDEKIGQSQPVPLGQRAESQLSCLLYRDDRLNTLVQTNRSVINHNLGTWGHYDTAASGIRVNKAKLRQSRNNPCRTGSAD